MRVVCYRNLRRRDCSIAEVKGDSGIGRVIAHECCVALADVTFVVKEAARQRVIQNRRREVHAWAVGELVENLPTPNCRTPITYNPYRAAIFTTREGLTPVHASPFVEFTDSRGALAVLPDDPQ